MQSPLEEVPALNLWSLLPSRFFSKTEKAGIEGFRMNKKRCLPLSQRAHKKSGYTNQGNRSLHFSLNGGVIEILCTEIFGRFQNKEKICEPHQ